MAKKNKPLPIRHFDDELRYDLYFEAAGGIQSVRNVRVLCVRTWEPIEDQDDIPSSGFLEVHDAQDRVTYIDADSITVVTAAGVRPAIDGGGF